jgi:hypothetical protein
MVTSRLSVTELGVFTDIDFVGHGTLFGVKIEKVGNPLYPKELLAAQKCFVDTLRVEMRFDRVIIHGGLPAYAEVDGETPNGRKFTKKFKF